MEGQAQIPEARTVNPTSAGVLEDRRVAAAWK
jgi:hypothetical protein